MRDLECTEDCGILLTDRYLRELRFIEIHTGKVPGAEMLWRQLKIFSVSGIFLHRRASFTDVDSLWKQQIPDSL